MTSLWTDLDRTFSELDRRMRAAQPALRGPRHAPQRPLVQAARDEGGWTLTVDLPGVPLDDISLHIDGGTLHLDATRAPRAPEGARSLRRERGAWTLAERLAVPAGVDTDAVTARLRNGRLTVRLPLQGPRSRTIPIETA